MASQEHKATKRSDAELMVASNENDTQAFSELYHRHKKSVYNYLVRSLRGNRKDAEEALQETFLCLFNTLERYNEQGRFRSWLFAIATNYMRKQSRIQRRKELSYNVTVAEDEASELQDIIPDESKRPDKLAHERELSARIQKTIDQLPRKYKDVINLCYVNGFSYKECGEALNISEKKVSVWMYRAREKFVDHFDLKDFDIKFFTKNPESQEKLGMFDRIFNPPQRVRYLISCYIDGYCTEQQERVVRRALGTDSKWSAQLETYNKIGVVYDQLETLAVAPALDHLILESIEESIRARAMLSLVESIFLRVKYGLEDFKKTFIDSFARPYIPIPIRVAASVMCLLLVVYVSQYQIDHVRMGRPYAFHMTGDVRIFDREINQWVELSEGQRLRSGDQIKVEEGVFDIRLRDVYALRMREGAVFTCVNVSDHYKPGTTSFQLKKGTMLAKLGKKFEGSVFEVNTAHFDFMARGTAGEIEVRQKYGIVRGIEGNMTVSDNPLLAGQEVIFKNGEMAAALSMDPLQIKSLLAEINEIFSHEITAFEFHSIEDVAVQLGLPYSEDRIEEYFKSFSIQFVGADADQFLKYFDLPEFIYDYEDLLHIRIENIRHFANEIAKPGFTPEMLLFVSSIYYQQGSYREAVDVLQDIISYQGDDTWKSLALSIVGQINRAHLDNPLAAEEYFNRVVAEYPFSPEAAYIQTRISSPPGI